MKCIIAFNGFAKRRDNIDGVELPFLPGRGDAVYIGGGEEGLDTAEPVRVQSSSLYVLDGVAIGYIVVKPFRIGDNELV